MRALFLAAATLALLAVVVAATPAPTPAPTTTRTTLEFAAPLQAPAEWRRVAARAGELEAAGTVQLHIGLRQPSAGLAELERRFWAVSDPESAEYGQHVKELAEVTALVAPSAETAAAVRQWLQESCGGGDDGDVEITANGHGDWLQVALSGRQAAAAFDAEVSVWQHRDDAARRIVRSLGPYSVPAELAARHIDVVVGLTGFPLPARKLLDASGTAAAPTLAINPRVLRERYNITDEATSTAVNNTQAVAEFQEQYVRPSDLDVFFKRMTNYTTLPAVQYLGKNVPGNPGDEASLDLQYIAGVAPQVGTFFVSTPAYNFWADLVQWTTMLNDLAQCPLVHSVSYGSQGQYPSAAYIARLDAEWQKLGVRGVSVIFASGDSGVGCLRCRQFQPSFPAVSPYVTSVGATQFVHDAIGDEMAVTEFGSGGGFAPAALNITMPAYQKAAVQRYLSTYASRLPPASFYNAAGRATPDVAALGWGFEIVQGGRWGQVGGTSAAAPTFAAVVSLLNQIRIAAGRPSLGFLNPFLYQTAAAQPDAFYDVVDGSNAAGCCKPGFVCTPGWDGSTGLGTPNFAVLSKLV